MLSFADQVDNLVAKHKSLLCVGLDPDLKKIPASFLKKSQPIFEFNKGIIEATKDLVCCYKPQIAYYSAVGAESELKATIQYLRKLQIPVILDSKRGDIGDTAQMYAREAFDRYEADAVTVNPYMGWETLEPFFERSGKGVIVLCKTSNPGSGDLQDLKTENDLTLYQVVAQKAQDHWRLHKNVMLVVGATHVEPLRQIRHWAPDVPFLVPGVGAQGGDLDAVLKAGLTPQKRGLIINSSRAILYADPSVAEPGEAARAAAFKVVTEMRAHL